MPTNKKKKRSKKRQQKLKAKEMEENMTYEDHIHIAEESEARKESLNYLSQWKHNREEWKFCKTRERWLVRNMYSIEKVPTSHFKILVKYLQGMYKNNFRNMIVENAKSIVEKDENIKLDHMHDKLDEESKEQMKNLKKKRALKILEKMIE